MFKKYINNINEIGRISFEERSHYYIKGSVAKIITKASNNYEEMIFPELMNSSKILVKPFWKDNSPVLNNSLLQKLLNCEGEVMQKYINNHTSFLLGIRVEVFNKLNKAVELLPSNYKIVLKAGYRPISVQIEILNKIQHLLKEKNPTLNDEELYKLATQYVADPSMYTPPHSTCGAIDIALFNTTQDILVDMGSPLNYPGERSWTYNSHNLTSKQIYNRKLITNTMIKAGFANLASEWWHYSYGDQRWAIFYEKNEALYSTTKEYK